MVSACEQNNILFESVMPLQIINKKFSNNTFKKIAVPLHAMEAHGGRGGIAPTHT
jgi:hypothetical protein